MYCGVLECVTIEVEKDFKVAPQLGYRIVDAVLIHCLLLAQAII